MKRPSENARLEGVVRWQKRELNSRSWKLKQGADREKEGADREKEGADREKEGAVREKISSKKIVKFELEVLQQREELLHVTRVGKLAEFVSSLAHEISQPLTAIRSYAQAAQRMLGDREPDVQEVLQHINNDSLRAAMTIQRLRSLLKKGKPEVKPIDMNVLIQETIELVAADTIVRNVTLKTALESHLPFVHGDRIQLQQVLLNLISNSFEALGGGEQDPPHGDGRVA